MPAATALAHQGGWDEILIVLAPLAFLAVLLVVARRRAERELAEAEAVADADDVAAAPGEDRR